MSFFKEYVDNKQLLGSLWLALAAYDVLGETYEPK